MTKPVFLGAITLVVALGASASASADLQSNAQLSNVSFTLVDLNPGDSIAPSITWTGSALFSLEDDVPQPPDAINISGAPFGLTRSASMHGLTVSLSPGSASVSFPGPATTPPLSLSGSAMIASGGFTLGPWTRLVVSGDMSASTSAVGPAGAPPLALGTEEAFNIFLAVPGPDGSWTRSSGSGGLIGSFVGGGMPDSGPISVSEHIVATLDNASGTSLSALADVGVELEQLYARPVPEPSSLALAISGLGLLGLYRRRSSGRQD